MPTLNLRSFRLLKICILAVLALTVLGTVGFHYIEHWSWFDSLYMVAITLSTIGYQEVHELSHRGRIFNLGSYRRGRVTDVCDDRGSHAGFARIRVGQGFRKATYAA